MQYLSQQEVKVNISSNRFQQKQYECYLCHKNTTQRAFFETVTKRISICLECSDKINQTYFETFKHNYQLKFSNPITNIPFCQYVWVISDFQKFYDLQIIQCEICFEIDICQKVCNNNHYCCCHCMSKYVQTNLNKEIKCFHQGCQITLDHFVVSKYIPKNHFYQWKALTCQIFCSNFNCTSEIFIRPFEQLKGTIQTINSNQSKCKKCKGIICNKCWYQHSGKCQNEKMFKQYCKSQGIIKCPKCNIISQPRICYKNTIKQDIYSQIESLNSNIQQCPLCLAQFCNDCQSTNIQLFSSQSRAFLQTDHQSYTFCYNCQKQYYSKCNILKRAIRTNINNCCFIYLPIIYLLRFVVFILMLPALQFMQIWRMVGDFVENQISKVNRKASPYIFCCCGPVIALVTITSILILYVVLFIPLAIKNSIAKYKGEQF